MRPKQYFRLLFYIPFLALPSIYPEVSLGQNSFAEICFGKQQTVEQMSAEIQAYLDRVQADQKWADLTSSDRPTPRPDMSGGVQDPYQNPNGCFSRSSTEAENCTHSDWLNLDEIEKAQFIYKKYEELLAVHGLDYSPRILTCKVKNESDFNPQIKNGGSTASGLAQVTAGTSNDFFDRYGSFEFKTAGFADVNASTAAQKFSKSIVGQLEWGLGIYYMKIRDFGGSNAKDVLKNYYGSSESRNRCYADSIFDCATCIQNNGNKITSDCLKLARPSEAKPPRCKL